MSNNYDNEFWEAIDALVSSGKISIDRPKGASHPRFPNVVYPIDYGYIENTSAPCYEGIERRVRK